MSFLNKILPKKETKEYFLTVGVEENRITATVSLITDKQITIIGTGISEFDDTTEETEAADIAISEAEKKVGSDILVQKVIFGLPVSLIENDKIKPQHLIRLKKISGVLSLTPCGFIEYPQALSYYLEIKEESPPTLLLMSIGKNLITVSHIRIGKVEKNVTVEKTLSIISDFEKALSSFSPSEILPSRIMLYDEAGDATLDDIREDLLKFAWHKNTMFLHTPKISTLESKALTYALVETAGKSLVHEIHLEEKETVSEPPVTKDKEEMKKSQEETFGFVKNKDIMDEEVSGKPPETPQIKEEKPDMQFQKPQNVEQPFSAGLPKFNFALPQIPAFRFPLIPLVISAVLIMVFFAVTIWYYPKVTVNLIIYPATSISHTEVTFTTDANSLSSVKNSILASTVSENVSGDKNTTTTGTTKIGEKAKGTVTIYNKTANSKTLAKGTVIISDNLKFTLDSDVTVASSSDTGEGLTFGKAVTDVTAAEIGPDSNLAAGTNFTFKDFDQSLYYAKNTDKLTGGSSRDITSVSKNDQDNLLSALTQELTSRAKQQMLQKLKNGEKLLDVSVDSTVTSKKFSKNVGDESKDLNLTLELKVSGLTYKEQDLTALTHGLQSQAPGDYVLDQDKTGIHIDGAKTAKNGDVLGQATITYFFLPQIDTDKVRTAVYGKTFSDTDNYLHSVQNIGGVEITSETKLPFLSNRLPWNKKNITVNLVTR